MVSIVIVVFLMLSVWGCEREKQNLLWTINSTDPSGRMSANSPEEWLFKDEKRMEIFGLLSFSCIKNGPWDVLPEMTNYPTLEEVVADMPFRLKIWEADGRKYQPEFVNDGFLAKWVITKEPQSEVPFFELDISEIDTLALGIFSTSEFRHRGTYKYRKSIVGIQSPEPAVLFGRIKKYDLLIVEFPDEEYLILDMNGGEKAIQKLIRKCE